MRFLNNMVGGTLTTRPHGLVISHGDMDGFMSAYLAGEFLKEKHGVCLDVDYITSLNPTVGETEKLFETALENARFTNNEKFDYICVTDRALSKETVEKMLNEYGVSKIYYFDHYKDSDKDLYGIDNLVVYHNESVCATHLVWENTDALKNASLVRLVDLWDTFKWKDEEDKDISENAVLLNDIFGGITEYCDNKTNFILNYIENIFKFTEFCNIDVVMENIWDSFRHLNIDRFIEEYLENVDLKRSDLMKRFKHLKTDEKFLVCFVANNEVKYTSMVAHYKLEENAGHVVVFVNPFKGTYSFRTNENSSVTAVELARKFGGNGHTHAAGSLIDENLTFFKVF